MEKMMKRCRNFWRLRANLNSTAYATEMQLDAEELYSASGKSPVEIPTLSMGDWAGENMSEMATLKRLAQGMGDLEQQYVNSGDLIQP